QVIHLLQLLLARHPAMKAVVVREVQQYLHRPGLQPKATYAGVIFLNQVMLMLGGRGGRGGGAPCKMHCRIRMTI
ncbi:unnamed protein product, partial [Laminaria digitata]